MPANPALPTLWIIGDSTVRNGQGNGANNQWGWGDLVGQYFDPAKINVVNRALGGRSSRTFITEGHWADVTAGLKAGDFVLMQFGHNDGGPVNDSSRARGTLKGTGDETQEMDNLVTYQHEVVHSFGWYMRQYISDTRKKGATPIVCSLVPRKIWKEDKITRNAGDYAGWARQVAESEKAPFIDLNEMIAARYDQLGPEQVDRMFGDEHTHTTRSGAQLNAEYVIAGLKALTPDPLAPYFSMAAQEVSASGTTASNLPTDEKQMYGLITNMTTVAGRRDELIAILTESVSGMPGCASYVIAKDSKDENTVWITEVWDSKEDHDASLKLPGVAAAITKARPLIAAFGHQTVTIPVGGFGLPKARASR